MKALKLSHLTSIIILTLLHALAIAQVKPQKQPSGKESFSCLKFLFDTSLGDIVYTQGKRNLVANELWNEYEPNEPFKSIPDSIDVFTIIYNESLNLADNSQEFLKEFIKTEPDVYCTVTIQIKLSIDLDCTHPKNPRLSREYVVIDKKRIRATDFIREKPNQWFSASVGAIFPIRQKIKENGGYLPNSSDKEPELVWFVNQLIVRTYLSPLPVSVNKENAKCYVEYIHPVCAKVMVPPFTRD